jgi:hypothetical protein
MQRPMSAEVMAFHRKEQMRKLRAIFKRIFKLKKIDQFRIGT